MTGLFENTVSAICDNVVRSHNLGIPRIDSPPWNDVTRFVIEQWRRMPRFLAWPLRIATVAFAWKGFLADGMFFHELTPQRRQAQMDSWRRSSMSGCRDMIRFYRSLALLALYDRERAS